MKLLLMSYNCFHKHLLANTVEGIWSKPEQEEVNLGAETLYVDIKESETALRLVKMLH